MTPEQAIKEIENGNFYRAEGVKEAAIEALKEIDKDCTGCKYDVPGLIIAACEGCSRGCVDCYEAEDESDECFDS